MSKKMLNVFMDVGELRAIGAESLRALFRDFDEYFTAHNISLVGDDEAFPFEEIADLLQSAREELPPRLVNALYLITEMADATGTDMLLDLAVQEGIRVEGALDQLSPADLATRLYLANPERLEGTRDERTLKRKHTFIHFQASGPAPAFRLDSGSRQRFVDACNESFKARLRGEGVKLKDFRDGRVIRYMVRHGETLTRKGILWDNEDGSIIYRPAMYDAFLFDPRRGSLGMTHGPKWQQELYRRQFGLLLYNDEEAFQPLACYTLCPLQIKGRNALACRDIDGLKQIRLVELEYERHGKYGIRCEKSDDVFLSLADDAIDFPVGRLLRARFMVSFEGAGERYFEIGNPRKAVYERSGDVELLMPWLEARGFIMHFEATEVEVDVA